MNTYDQNLIGKLIEVGYQCGKIADDILSITKNDLENVLFVVPLRGGLPIYVGVSIGLHKLLGKPYEINAVFIPASSTVENRYELISEIVEKELKKKSYKMIIILDEAISGSSSKMVLDATKTAVKNLHKGDRYWEKNYWRELPVYLFNIVAYNGIKYDPKIKKKPNVMTYTVSGRIPTTDSVLYPMSYINVLEYVPSKSGKKYPVVSPDVIFYHKPEWKEVVKAIERGVNQYVIDKQKLENDLRNYEDDSLTKVAKL